MARTTPNPSSSSSPLKFPALSGFESVPSNLEGSRVKMNRAMAGLFVGPMPVDQFLKDFLPPIRGTPNAPNLRKEHFNKMPRVKVEKEMYEPFINLIHDHNLIPGYNIVDTANYPDHDMENGSKIKPDPSMYHNSVDTSVKRTQFGELELHFELKSDNSADPFDDPGPDDRLTHSFSSRTIKGSECRSQLIHYATEWCSRQHRRFAFTVFIGDPYVRFIRWDRAGAVVSEKFDYRKDSRPLIKFLWRFTHRDDAARGKDPTVRRATAEEVEFAREHLSEWKPKVERPVVVFEVIDDDGERRRFIAWGSMAHPGSLTGRCTRAYPVYERKTRKRYFLKDTWRAHDLGQEADILRELQAKNVQHIPPFVCGGDLPDDVTMTDLFVPEEEEDDDEDLADPAPVVKLDKPAPRYLKRNGSWRCGSDWMRITQRFHHRFVVDFIGKPLDQFSSSKHMMEVVHNAFTAHRQAYEGCQILHRDISSRNILIDDAGHGVLNDWDLAKRVSELDRARRHERTGTWEFMSCLLLLNHHTIHSIQDDMESFVHIILYHGLRYFPHNKPEQTLNIIKDIFDYERINNDGTRSGGDNKKAMFRAGTHLGDDFQFAAGPLQGWMEWAFAAVKQWINHVNPPHLNDDKALAFGASRRGGKSGSSPAARRLTAVECQLYDHDAMDDALHYALSLTDWPADDTQADALPRLRRLMASSKRCFDSLGSEGLGEGSTTGGSTKRSKTSQSLRGSGYRSGSSHRGLGSESASSHPMGTRSRTERSNGGGSDRV